MPGIIVLGEVDNGQMQPVTAELLAAGRRLQKILGCDVGAALLGAKVGDASASAFSYGADVVYAVEDPLLGEPSADAVVAALHEVCRRVEPDVVLVGRSAVGRAVGPRLAFRLGVGVAQDPGLPVDRYVVAGPLQEPLQNGGRLLVGVPSTGDYQQLHRCSPPEMCLQPAYIRRSGTPSPDGLGPWATG